MVVAVMAAVDIMVVAIAAIGEAVMVVAIALIGEAAMGFGGRLWR
jgi:hypothetical protein